MLSRSSLLNAARRVAAAGTLARQRPLHRAMATGNGQRGVRAFGPGGVQGDETWRNLHT